MVGEHGNQFSPRRRDEPEEIEDADLGGPAGEWRVAGGVVGAGFAGHCDFICDDFRHLIGDWESRVAEVMLVE